MSAIETSEIVCANGMAAFLARPPGDEPNPLVILMHERYGLGQHTRDLALKCAADGFFVMAPNFFFRHPDQAALNAGKARYDLSDMEALESFAAAVAAARRDPRADTHEIAVAGYCQTGRFPLVFAANAGIKAAIVWYGAASKREWPATDLHPRTMEEIIARLNCPVFAAFGADDHIISIDDVRRFRDTLEQNRKSYDIHVYAGAPHGWLNDTMPGRYRKAQAAIAWAAQQQFLAEVLRGGPNSSFVEWRFESDIPADYDFARNKRME